MPESLLYGYYFPCFNYFKVTRVRRFCRKAPYFVDSNISQEIKIQSLCKRSGAFRFKRSISFKLYPWIGRSLINLWDTYLMIGDVENGPLSA